MIINMNGAKAPETPSPTLQEKTVTPETLPVVIGADEGYDGLSQVTVNPDAQLKAENIRSGKTVFGVTGTFEGSGNKTELEEKLLTAMKFIPNDYTFDPAEYKAAGFYDTTTGMTTNGIPTVFLAGCLPGTVNIGSTIWGSGGCKLIYCGSRTHPFNLITTRFGNSTGGGDGSYDISRYKFINCYFDKVTFNRDENYVESTNDCFYKCGFRQDIVIPEGIKSYSGITFYKCFKIDENGNKVAGLKVTFPSTLTSMGNEELSFDYYYHGILEYKCTSPPSLGYYGYLYYVDQIIVPAGSKEAYVAASQWNKLADKIVEATE